MFICQHCQKSFKPLRSNKKIQKFCSNKCRLISTAKKPKKIQLCLNCNKETTNPKFCSHSCSATFTNTGVTRWSTPGSIGSRYKLCKTCGKDSGSLKYCSDECNPHRLHMTSEEKYKYKRAKKNESWHRYMAKKKNQTPPNIDLKVLQTFYINCPEGYEVDHIIPISKGGLHCIENLQYLTISENRKKSNKIIGESEGIRTL